MLICNIFGPDSCSKKQGISGKEKAEKKSALGKDHKKDPGVADRFNEFYKVEMNKRHSVILTNYFSFSYKALYFPLISDTSIKVKYGSGSNNKNKFSLGAF